MYAVMKAGNLSRAHVRSASWLLAVVVIGGENVVPRDSSPGDLVQEGV